MNINEIFQGSPISVTFSNTLNQMQPKPDLIKIMVIAGTVTLIAIFVYENFIKEEKKLKII